MNVPRFGVVLLGVCTLVLGLGCAPKRKEITDRERREAALLVDEARFAINVRDWSRAEGLLAKAAQITPDADIYRGLAAARIRLGNRPGAKEAYKAALRIYEDKAAADANRVEPWLNQVQVLALMGQMDESRAVLAKAAKRFPNDDRVKTLLDPKQFQQMTSAPGFKEIAL